MPYKNGFITENKGIFKWQNKSNDYCISLFANSLVLLKIKIDMFLTFNENILLSVKDLAPSGASRGSSLENNFTASHSEEVITNVPPKYADGSFRQRPNGVLEYRFMYLNKQISVYGQSEKECFNKRTAIISQTKNNTTSKNSLAFDIWILEWYNRFRRSKQNEKCQSDAERRMEDMIKVFGKKPINKFTGEELQDYVNIFNNRRAEQEKVLVLIRASFLKALKLGHIKRDPCEVMDVAKYKSKHYPVIQFNEQRLIFEKERSEIYKKLFMIYCCTGARLTEFYNALPHIDFKNHIITIVDEDTATKKHRREIPFLPELFTESDRNEFLKISPRGIQSHFRRLFEELNLDIVIHSFRVTFISICAFIGINPKQIQEWAGHSTIGMTMDTYAKLLKKDGNTPILEYLLKLKSYLNL